MIYNFNDNASDSKDSRVPYGGNSNNFDCFLISFNYNQ